MPRVGIANQSGCCDGKSLYLDIFGVDIPTSVSMSLTAVLSELSPDLLFS